MSVVSCQLPWAAVGSGAEELEERPRARESKLGWLVRGGIEAWKKQRTVHLGDMGSSFGTAGMGGGMGGHGMHSPDRSSRGAGRAASAELTAKRPRPPLKKVLPEVWALMRPRRGLIAVSFLLMVVNRSCSFVLPVSSGPFINRVMIGHDMHLLPKIIAAVAGATFVQGVTSYALTQLLSTEGQ